MLQCKHVPRDIDTLRRYLGVNKWFSLNKTQVITLLTLISLWLLQNNSRPLGLSYTQTFFPYLKFKFNWISCVLSGICKSEAFNLFSGTIWWRIHESNKDIFCVGVLKYYRAPKIAREGNELGNLKSLPKGIIS